MSMIGHVRQITTEELKNLQEDPSLVRRLVKAQVRATTEEMVAALERVQKIALAGEGLLTGQDAATERAEAQVQILKELEAVGVRVPGENGEEGLSLEKSWHTLHYLLTGKADQAPAPLGNAILGGTEIGDDVGYGPARFLTLEQGRDVVRYYNEAAAKGNAMLLYLD